MKLNQIPCFFQQRSIFGMLGGLNNHNVAFSSFYSDDILMCCWSVSCPEVCAGGGSAIILFVL